MLSFLNFLHVAPLFTIAIVLCAPSVYHFITGKNFQIKSLDAILLLLCSIGVASGSNIHHQHGHADIMMYMIDPCFCYAAVLIGVAFKSFNLSKLYKKVIAR